MKTYRALLPALVLLTPTIAKAGDEENCIKNGGVWVVNFEKGEYFGEGVCVGDVPIAEPPPRPWDRYPEAGEPPPPEPPPPAGRSRNPLWNAPPPLPRCPETIDKPLPPGTSGTPESPPRPMDCIVTHTTFAVEIVGPENANAGESLTANFGMRVTNISVGTALRGYRMEVVLSGGAIEETVLTRILGAYDLSPGQTIAYPFAGATMPFLGTGDYQVCIKVASEDMIGWGLTYRSEVPCKSIHVTGLALPAEVFEPPSR